MQLPNKHMDKDRDRLSAWPPPPRLSLAAPGFPLASQPSEDFLKLISGTCFIYGPIPTQGLCEARPSLVPHNERVGHFKRVQREKRENQSSVYSLEKKKRGGAGVEIADLLNKAGAAFRAGQGLLSPLSPDNAGPGLAGGCIPPGDARALGCLNCYLGFQLFYQ